MKHRHSDDDDAQHILIIEDEPHIRKFLRITLTAHGYRVSEARLGHDGLERAAQDAPDLVILDLGLPDIDGVQIISRLRAWTTVPVLVLSVRGEERQKVEALDTGANDYVTKPASIGELMARIRALLRSRPSKEPEEAVFRTDGLEVDMARRVVTLAGEAIHLTRKEYDLLSLLASRPGQVATHQFILREIWGPAFENETQYLRVLMSALRQKLRDDPSSPRFIATEQGVGYRLLQTNGS